MPTPTEIFENRGQFRLRATTCGYDVTNLLTKEVVKSEFMDTHCDSRTFMQTALLWLENAANAGTLKVDDNIPAPKVSSLNEYQQAASITAVFNKEQTYYPYLGLAGEAGEVCELAKKAMRDEKGEWSKERKDKLRLELGDVMWYIAIIAMRHGMTLEDVGQANIAKLHSRIIRGKLHGSGDHR